LLLKEISVAYFASHLCGFSPAWHFANNLAGRLDQFCRNGFFATGIASFTILRIAVSEKS